MSAMSLAHENRMKVLEMANRSQDNDDGRRTYPNCANQPEHARARGDDVVDERPECAVGFCAGECGGEGEEGVGEECEGGEEEG